MKKTFRLQGLDCANCAAKMEAAIQKIPGVTAATVQFMTSRLTLEAEREDMPVVLEQAAALIKKLEPDVVITKA